MKRTFPINKIYHQEVQTLLGSRRTGSVFHNAGDIRASGDETEIAFRQFLARRLPQKYLVGHGHVVDRFLNVSPQCDIIIADNSATPILLEGKDGVQFFPFESVYAIGEVKSTYMAGHISAFVKVSQEIQETLKRDPVPPEYIGNGVTLGAGFKPSDSRPFRNSLFHFMIFFDSGAYDDVGAMEQYHAAKEEYLPAVACFLDGRILSKAKFHRPDNRLEIDRLGFDPFKKVDHTEVDWVRVLFEQNNQKAGQALAVFMMQLFDHLDHCTLKPPPIHEYLNNVLKDSSYSLMPLSVEFFLNEARIQGIELPEDITYTLKDGRILLDHPQQDSEKL